MLKKFIDLTHRVDALIVQKLNILWEETANQKTFKVRYKDNGIHR